MTTTTTEPRARRRRKGRGTVFQRSDGRWCAKLALDGGRTKYIYGASESEVDRRLTEAKATINAGDVLPDDRKTLGYVLDRFLEERSARVRASTMAAYRCHVDVHLKPHVGKVLVRALTPAAVQAFVASRSRDGVTAATIQHVLVTLRMALSLAEDWGLVARNVARRVHGPKHARPDFEPLTADDTMKLLGAARTHRLGAIWFIAASLGLRRGEILGLRWQDIELVRGTLTVRHQLAGAMLAPPKTKRALRTLALSPTLIALLRERKAAQAAEQLKAGAEWRNDLGLVFTSLKGKGRPLDGCRMHRLHRELCSKAGVRAVRFHDLRHGAATLMLGAGVDVVNLSASLGHADVAFSLSRYTHATRPRMDDAVGKLAGVLGLDGVT